MAAETQKELIAKWRRQANRTTDLGETVALNNSADQLEEALALGERQETAEPPKDELVIAANILAAEIIAAAKRLRITNADTPIDGPSVLLLLQDIETLACGALPTNHPRNAGALVLNAYGRTCYDAGKESALAAPREGPATADLRAETGPMQFGDDWPGIFIRGDNAAGFMIAIDALLNSPANPLAPVDPFAMMTLKGLRDTLAGCDVRTNPKPQSAALTFSAHREGRPPAAEKENP